MKKHVLFMFCVLLFVSISPIIAQISSNGTGGGNWSATATWAGGVVPDGSGTVTITGSDSVVVDVPVSITGILLNNSTRTGSGQNQIIGNGNLTIANGGTYQHNTNSQVIPTATWSTGSTFHMTAAWTINNTAIGGTQAFYNIIWDGSAGQTSNVNLRVATGGGTGTVNGDITVLSTGSGRFYLADGSGSVVNVAGSINVSGSSQFAITGASASSVTANVGGDITVSGTANFGTTRNSASPGIINLTGNLSVASGTTYANSQTSAAPYSKFVFVGAGSHTCSFTPTSVPGATTSGINFEVAGGGTVNLSSNLTIPLSNLAGAGTLTLTSGKFVTGANTIIINNTQSTAVSTGSSTAYIDGQLRRAIASTSSTSITFPIGKGSAYRPATLTITQDAATSTTYTAEVFNSAPTSNTLPGTLDLVSSVRHYTISKGAGANVTAASIQFSYDTDDGVSDESNLRIAKDDGAGNWVDLGGSGTATTTGTITSSTNFTTFSEFVLANNTGGSNALPVELSSFSATSHNKSVELKWNTATEVNNNGFAVERASLNPSKGGTWEKIGFVSGAGTSNNPKQYSYTDASLVSGKYSYRLKQIDNDGKFSYSNAVEVNVGSVPTSLTFRQNYPNPFNPTTNLEFAVPQNGEVVLRVVNVIGQEVATVFRGIAEAGQVYVAPFNASNLPSGIYFSVLEFSGKKLTQKMLLMK